jgi:hypothetical protein
MARPKADLPAAEAIRALVDDQGRLPVRVTLARAWRLWNWVRPV